MQTVADKLVTLALVRKGAEFRVEFFESSFNENVKPEEIEKLLVDAAESIVKTHGDLIESQGIEIGAGEKKIPARDVSFKQENGATTRCRLTVVSGRFCAASTTTADADVAAKFLKSLLPLK